MSADGGKSGKSSKSGENGPSERSKQLLAAKSDINAAYSPQEIARLQKFAKDKADAPVEWGQSWFENGKEYYKLHTDNKEDSVSMPYAVGGTNVHNHPNSGFDVPNSIAARIGTAFSGADLALGGANPYGAGTQQKAMRVASKGYDYNMDFRGGKKISYNTLSRNFDKKYREISLDLHNNYVSKQPLSHRAAASDRAYLIAVHRTNQWMADKYGWKYTRKRRDY